MNKNVKKKTNIKMSSFCYFFFVVLCSVIFSSCSSNINKTHYYSLSILTDSHSSGGTSTFAQAELPVVGVYPLKLPDYLKHSGIVSKVYTDLQSDFFTTSASSQLKISKEQVWAGELDREATRVLSATLRRSLSSYNVIQIPWSNSSPEIVLKITVDEFVGSLDKEVFLSGQIELIKNSMSPKTSRLYTFDFNEPIKLSANASSKRIRYQNYISAHNRALKRLSDYLVVLINQ